MPKTTKEDLEAALRAIAIIPHAYRGNGGEWQAKEMQRIAVEAVKGKWAGVTKAWRKGR